MIAVSKKAVLFGFLSVRDAEGVLDSVRVDVKCRSLHLSPEHPRCFFRQRAAGSPVFAQLVQLAVSPHTPSMIRTQALQLDVPGCFGVLI